MAKNFDYLAKLGRARRHMEDLETALYKWSKEDHHTTFDEPDPNGGPNARQVRVVADRIPADPFAVLIGDVIHNLRGTLDHLAFALAESHSGTPLPLKFVKRSEFPIFGNETGNGAELFQNAREAKIGAIHPDAQALIESLQPYHGGNEYASHPLWMLHELSNIDKHRLLLMGSIANAYMAVHPELLRHYRFSDAITVYDAILEPEAVVCRYSVVPIDPTYPIDVKFDPVLKIVFSGGGSVKGKNVFKTIKDIFDCVEDSIVPALKPFL